ncbi:MAG TPA: 3-deoxy-D-manno-octulosonic acid transferase [Vicinamibacteria bacterium]|nr:3-deoxy-D-manno-octulosonic acid transferase [Vicinamibacteria bacterium]
MYLLYNVLLAVAFTLSIPYYLWKGRGTGKYLKTFRERFGRLPQGVAGDSPSLWIHAVSVGEVLAARALLGPLGRRLPGRRLVVSTTTLTGNDVARRSLSGHDALFFAPFDFPGPSRHALRAVRAELLVLVETELWPNLIREARRRGARVALVNGRISPRSFPRYRRLRFFLEPVLDQVDLFLMQAEAHAERILAMGAPPGRVRVTGNLKFDAVDVPAPSPALESAFAPLRGRPILLAGSTTEGEEAALLRVYARLLAAEPDLALAIAPRHPERFEAVPPLAEALGLRCRRRRASDGSAWRNGEVLLLDTLGELASAYSYATVAFVGGSLVQKGGHNVLEAAAWGKPVVVGPHMENFQEIADQFRAEGALVQVGDEGELMDALSGLLTDGARRRELGEHARALVDRNRGALQRTVDALAALVA